MHIKAAGTAMLLVFVSVVAQAEPETITYQGSLLTAGGAPVPDGTYRMTFALYDAAIGGTHRWTETLDVNVRNGLFSTTLGLTSSLHGIFMSYPELWLLVTADVDRSGTFDADEVFQPLQRLNGAPWACPRVEPLPESPNLIGGHGGNHVGAGVHGAAIAGGGSENEVNRVLGDFGAIGGGLGNRTFAEGATIGGGFQNFAAGTSSTIGGGALNSISSEAIGATIGGGGQNSILERYSTVGGGHGNSTRQWYSTIGGGYFNETTGTRAVVAGGTNNTAGPYATVGGGGNNKAAAYFSTIPGGRFNKTYGDYSCAMGYRAIAKHDGSFVLADSTDADYPSIRDNQLRARFNGGVMLSLNNGQWVEFFQETGHLIDTSANGAHLTAGGTWANGSDRNAKENFKSVDTREVLDRLADVPIQLWNYKAEKDSVRHMGPVAQDLYAAFGLGGDDKTITTVDADGISLAAIQGLYRIIREKNAMIETQQKTIDNINARLLQVEEQLAAMRE